jgi:hypothetical protein
VNSGNSVLEGLGALGKSGCATGGRADESASVALAIMGATYLRAELRDLWLRQIGRPSQGRWV